MKKADKLYVVKKFIWAAILPVILLLLWQRGVETGAINPSILPKPTRIWETLCNYFVTGKLAKNLLVSFRRVVIGFGIGMAAGLVMGLIMGLYPVFESFTRGLVGILRPIPLIAWIPVLILWLGIGEESKIICIAIGTFWPVLLNTIRGIQSVDKKLMEVARILEKKRHTVLLKVVIPSALPSVFTGIRLGIGNAWSCVVAAEMFGATAGIGYTITYGKEMAQPDLMLLGVFVIGMFGLLLDIILLHVEKHMLAWSYTEET